jgi:serine/threonine protein kinase
MTSEKEDAANLAIAHRWCLSKGAGWSVVDTAGKGGTAPVFGVNSPDGPKALKLFDLEFSTGDRGVESEKRVALQVGLGVHDCPYIVQTYGGGRFEDRLFLLMNRAPGQELEKRLPDIPRSKIRQIIDQAAQACTYLRGRSLCHRDLKSANVFITDDFETITVLDLSVIREIQDPVGMGTDHGGQLPVVATSRYSPPEYLFRLVDPGAVLWHALDIYQLGGLLHDLIMREPMFQAEYLLSKENRYRFAWIVATQEPKLAADDVDNDLIFLARRALDKDWKRRSALRLEDFLDEAGTHRLQGMEALGLTTARMPAPQPTGSETPARQIYLIAKALEEEVRLRLKNNGVTATHSVDAGPDDYSAQVTLGWNSADATTGAALSNVNLAIGLRLQAEWSGSSVTSSICLSATVESTRRQSEMTLPSCVADNDTVEKVAGGIMSAIGGLASLLMRNQVELS